MSKTNNENEKILDFMTSLAVIEARDVNASNFQSTKESAQPNKVFDRKNSKDDFEEKNKKLTPIFDYINILENNTIFLKDNIIKNLSQTKNTAPSMGI